MQKPNKKQQFKASLQVGNIFVCVVYNHWNVLRATVNIKWKGHKMNNKKKGYFYISQRTELFPWLVHNVIDQTEITGCRLSQLHCSKNTWATIWRAWLLAHELDQVCLEERKLKTLEGSAPSKWQTALLSIYTSLSPAQIIYIHT